MINRTTSAMRRLTTFVSGITSHFTLMANVFGAASRKIVELSLTVAVLTAISIMAPTSFAAIDGSSGLLEPAQQRLTGIRQEDCRVDPAQQVLPNSEALNYLHTCGNRILDRNGEEFVFIGVNWSGLETPAFAPHGLARRRWEDILDEITYKGYNAIRLPFSNEALEDKPFQRAIDFQLNPDLQGLSTLEIMDKIINGARRRGLRIVLDRHRPTSSTQAPLWYTDTVSEQRWIEDWVMLARRYFGNDAVVGFDLHNEPHGGVTWGTDDEATDWRLAAERAGNAVLEVNPYLLIFVQGIDTYQDDYFWWGAQLRPADRFPVRLNVPNRLVYSPRDYGPEVYEQPYFHDPTFPANLEQIWDIHWGYLHKRKLAPIVIGEFDGPSLGDDPSGRWQKTLLRYLLFNRIGFFVWHLDPTVWERPGGITNNWVSFVRQKHNLAKQYLLPPSLNRILTNLDKGAGRQNYYRQIGLPSKLSL